METPGLGTQICLKVGWPKGPESLPATSLVPVMHWPCTKSGVDRAAFRKEVFVTFHDWAWKIT